MTDCVIPFRLRSEVDEELADYGFRLRDLNRLIERESRFLDQVDRDLETRRYSAKNGRFREGGEAEANSSR